MTKQTYAAFRADASLEIGNGHVMRCLTLAEELRRRGRECRFICRRQPGDLVEEIGRRGFDLTVLQSGGEESDESADARQSRAALEASLPHWLVVDHYSLGERWEAALRASCARLFVIDDRAVRLHDCDLLLDQNLGRSEQDYRPLVPARCKVLAGAQYAMLRQEFAALRSYSLQRRRGAKFRRIIVSMGGVDRENATGLVLRTLKSCELPRDCLVSVVMGPYAPWIEQVRAQAQEMELPTEVLVNVGDMARLMAESDLAIGAAGTTSWERCCLGLPAVVIRLAENQRLGAEALHRSGAAILIGGLDGLVAKLPAAVRAACQPETLRRMSGAAQAVTDGQGLDRVRAALEAAHA